MLKYLEIEEKEASRSLWEEAFPEDSRSFDDYYFKEKTKENRILAIKEDECMQAMIHLNPYLLQVRERRWRVDYLVGVATRKDKRHQGYMRRLLLKMMEDMHQESMPFCFLMPADERIYTPFGFTYIFDMPQWKLKSEKSLQRRRILCDSENVAELTLASQWMEQWLDKHYQVYAIRDQAYVSRLAREIQSENGKIEALYDQEKLVGLEGSWGLEQVEQRFLYCEKKHREESAEAKPGIMARIITPEVFVRVIRLKDKVEEEEISLLLQLEDPLILKNHGRWRWHLNHQTSWLERETDSGKKPDVTITVDKLTRWLFGYEPAQEAGHYGNQIETLCGIFLDEVV